MAAKKCSECGRPLDDAPESSEDGLTTHDDHGRHGARDVKNPNDDPKTRTAAKGLPKPRLVSWATKRAAKAK